MIETFDSNNFSLLCNEVAAKDAYLKSIIDRYGYPPLWSRNPSFETLVHIILEQQVSLASAKAALVKLQEQLGDITPKKLLALSDEEMKACYFSRQKIKYTRHLAETILLKQLDLKALSDLPDDEVRHQLKVIKGIGDWTVDVYLMMALHRCNLFPVGDIALVNSVRFELQNLQASKDEVAVISKNWEPYRTIAAFLFWHAYIKRKGIKI